MIQHSKKNNHASAWHMDNDKDVRSLMSITPNTRWWGNNLARTGSYILLYVIYKRQRANYTERWG